MIEFFSVFSVPDVVNLRWLVVVPILLLSAWLGARGLNADAVWYDEWLSIYYAGGAQYGPISPADIWQRVAERSTWPPGFQTMLAGWGALVGWHHLAGRALPWLIGLLAVAWTYRLGRDLVSARAGAYAAAALGASAFFVYYLHELRGYTLYAHFSALCVWSYWRIVTLLPRRWERGKNGSDSPSTRLRGRGGWGVKGVELLFLLSIVGLFYTHYFAVLTAAAVTVYHVLFVPKTRVWWRVPILIALGAASFIPWMGVAVGTASETLSSDARRIVPLNGWEILQALVYSFGNGSAALFLLTAVYSILPQRQTPPPSASGEGLHSPFPRIRRKGDGRIGVNATLLVWLWVLVTLVVLLLVNERMRVIFHIRHLMAVFPALALVVGLGVDRLRQIGVRPAVVLALWVGAGVWNALDPAFMRTQPGAEPVIPWASFSVVLDNLQRRMGSNDVVAFHVERPGREWLTQPVVDYYAEALPGRHQQMEEIPGLLPDDDYYRAVLKWLRGASKVWTVVMPDTPTTFHVAEFERAVLSKYAACGRVVDTPDMQLSLYLRIPDDPLDVRYRFGSGIGLRVIEPVPETARGTLDLLLAWGVAPDVPPETYSVALHVQDAGGNVVAQADYALPAVGYHCAPRRIDVSMLTPGEYGVYVGVYDWQTGARLAARDDGEILGDRISLGTLQIFLP